MASYFSIGFDYVFFFFLLFSFLIVVKMTPGKVTTNDNASNADLSVCTEVLQKDEAPTIEIKDLKKPIVSSDCDISNSIERNETKTNDTAQKPKIIDEKLTKLEVLKSISVSNDLKWSFKIEMN